MYSIPQGFDAEVRMKKGGHTGAMLVSVTVRNKSSGEKAEQIFYKPASPEKTTSQVNNAIRELADDLLNPDRKHAITKAL